MILHAEINQDGSLNFPIPQFLWGKKVIISIKEESDSQLSNRYNTSGQLDTTELQSELKSERDETAYLLSSEANVQQLEQAKQEFEKGQWIEVENLDELFK
ncbi:hypothetical protein [Candidatus Parabeggiatoa sp. HSG14]|uniref:hypothetical protein n=1 Tax=Candidatus Parabeggiatoa sp. HSG14 TaxID=3055593 RepID=UPI0025A7BC85|nr:hypothetical protein [Thiotrichales bacterium HSG14]